MELKIKLQLYKPHPFSLTSTFYCLDTEALLRLGQHELDEGSGTLSREVRGRRRLEVSEYLLLKHLECPRSPLE